MEFSLGVEYMSIFVFCKLEIVIFKIVQVMTENIPFAFLYVLSIGIPLYTPVFLYRNWVYRGYTLHGHGFLM